MHVHMCINVILVKQMLHQCPSHRAAFLQVMGTVITHSMGYGLNFVAEYSLIACSPLGFYNSTSMVILPVGVDQKCCRHNDMFVCALCRMDTSVLMV